MPLIVAGLEVGSKKKTFDCAARKDAVDLINNTEICTDGPAKRSFTRRELQKLSQ